MFLDYEDGLTDEDDVADNELNLAVIDSEEEGSPEAGPSKVRKTIRGIEREELSETESY